MSTKSIIGGILESVGFLIILIPLIDFLFGILFSSPDEDFGLFFAGIKGMDAFISLFFPFLIVGSIIAIIGIVIKGQGKENKVKKVIVCPYCNSENNADAIFCNSCGKRLRNKK